MAERPILSSYSRQSFDLRGKRIYVAGHRGMVGSALVRRLATEDCDILQAGRNEVDLTRQVEVEDWLAAQKPHAIFLAAAKVGGIIANQQSPADFLYDNLMIEANIIHAAHRVGVEKLLFLGSSCIYPKFAAQPITEDMLLTGALEPTNEWYAIAKIAGLKLCQAYRHQHGARFVSAMPTNLYGPNDNFDLTTSHVLPALMAKIYAAKVNGEEQVVIFGSGTPRREFLHVDDLADALVHLMKIHESGVPINIGTGSDVSIRELADMIAGVVGYEGGFRQDLSKPDGTPRKLLDVSALAATGWLHRIELHEGLASTFAWYRDSLNAA
ncbi:MULTISPECIES: GDP-L-fucose synthase [Hyphomicrobiales]|jgi:GDP-L-fucose synthase|uniref:GDP-L-fucose synthase n=1 Tax=Methylobacterium sp. CCH7-A2 TaxID=1768789 RepID=UPI00082ADC70|nr:MULTISPECIES: GDP-L-fucose synthase [Hyphomicrobiales]